MELAFDQNTMLTGYDFERNIASLLNGKGFKVQTTGNKDYGVDIIATKVIKGKEHVFNIQCKYYNRTVDNTPIQQVAIGTTCHDNGGRPVVITNNYFTTDARLYATKVGVELIGKPEWDILNGLSMGKPKPAQQIKGLLGILVGIKLNDPDYIDSSITDSKPKVPKKKETMAAKITTNFDMAEQWILEEAALYAKAAECHRKALNLQKEALLTNLEYI